MIRLLHLIPVAILGLFLLDGCSDLPGSSELEAPPTCPQLDDRDSWTDQVRQLLNARRAIYSQEPLDQSETLDALADQYVGEMIAGGFFGHDNPASGIRGRDRLANWREQHHYQMMGENIARGPRSPEQAVQEWLDSLLHRDNILEPDYTEVGVSIQRANDKYCFYWMTLFGTDNLPD